MRRDSQRATSGRSRANDKMGFPKWVFPLDDAKMSTTVTLDSAGRILIPKSLRDELRLEPGDSMQLKTEGEGVMLRPIRTASPLRRERGVWIFNGGRKISAAATDEVLRDIREQRDRDNRGTDR
jgi:AbrB family looped-hinge helix DNA binding protein